MNKNVHFSLIGEHLLFVIGMIFLEWWDDIRNGGIFIEGKADLHFSVED